MDIDKSLETISISRSDWYIAKQMRDDKRKHIVTTSYTIYDQYTSQLYHKYVSRKSGYGYLSQDEKDMHLFDVRYNDLNQIVYVYADDPFIAAIGLIDHGYIIIEHITKIVN